MQIVALRNLESCWLQPNRNDAEGALKAWLADAKLAQWTTPQDVKNQYANASVIANNRVVFNIKGNDHRLIVAIAYRMQYVYVKFIGTQAEYRLYEVLANKRPLSLNLIRRLSDGLHIPAEILIRESEAIEA